MNTPTESSQDLISIIVPIYNVAEYLHECIDSILLQTYTYIEVILINDGSTDNSGAICDEYAIKDTRVKVIHQNNVGVSNARNAGLDIAKGQWIGFVDGDDWISPEMYTSLIEAAINNGKIVSVCGFFKYHLDESVEKRVYSNLPKIIEQTSSIEYMMCNRYYEGHMCNKLFNRNVINEYPAIRLDENMHHCEDLLFATQVLLRTDGLAIVSDSFYHYRMREANSTNQFSFKKLTGLKAREQVSSMVKPISNEAARIANVYYVLAAQNIIYHTVVAGRYELLADIRKKAWRYARLFFLSDEIDLKLKIRGAAILCSPVLSYRIWELSKGYLEFTWWKHSRQKEF